MSDKLLPAISEQANLTHYIEKVKKIPSLSADEEVTLARRVVEIQDVKAAHRLITSHLKLVVKIANNFRGYNLPMLELISEGNIGLMQAVKKYDPELGYKLATYAMWWIKAAMQEYVLKSWSLVKIGTTAAQKKLFFNLRKMKSKIYALEHRDLNNDDIEQIAHTLNVSNEDVIEMNQRLLGHDISLNNTIGHDSEEEAINFLPENTPNQELVILQKNDIEHKHKLFKKALAELDARELKIIEERYLSAKPATLEELSQIFLISRERVRQLEERAISKLKKYVIENY